MIKRGSGVCSATPRAVRASSRRCERYHDTVNFSAHCGTALGSPRFLMVRGQTASRIRGMGVVGISGGCRDTPMRSMWSFRIAAVAFALVAASLGSFPSLSTTGAGLSSTPAASVNRALKGDRLPTVTPTAWQHEFRPPVTPLQSRARVPVGCDTSFSPISSPRLANVFQRCLV
jgi:hypothetical protein